MSRTHTVEIAGVLRVLPVVPVSDEVAVAFLKLYGDIELIEVAAIKLAASIRSDITVVLGPEAGGILLAHLVAVYSGKRYAVARKKIRPYMKDVLRASVQSIASVGKQELIIDDFDLQLIRGANVALIDEVVSSGNTISALRQLVEGAGGRVSQVLTVATEGEEGAHTDITSLCHLPVFRPDNLED